MYTKKCEWPRETHLKHINKDIMPSDTSTVMTIPWGEVVGYLLDQSHEIINEVRYIQGDSQSNLTAIASFNNAFVQMFMFGIFKYTLRALFSNS